MQRDVFSDELGVQFGRLHFDDVHVYFLAGLAAEFFLELVNFRAFSADDNAGTGGEDGDAATVGGALDQNSRHRGRFQFLLEQGADFAVLVEQLAEFFLAGIPLRAPVFVDGDAQTDWISFLAHIIRQTK